MITASQQIDRVANSLTHLAKSRVIPARVIKPLVLRLDRLANTLDRRTAAIDGEVNDHAGIGVSGPGSIPGAFEKMVEAFQARYPNESPGYIEKVIEHFNGDIMQIRKTLEIRKEQKGGMHAAKKKSRQR